MSETGRPASVLVVIPCLNEAAHIERVIRQVLDPALDLHLVVVDGGSTDGTQEIVKELAADERISLLSNPHRIQSSAVNLAVATFGAQARYLVRIDAHSQYPSGFVAALLGEADDTGADSIVIAMHTAGHSAFQQGVAAAQNSALGNGGSSHRNAGERRSGKWVDHGHHALIRVAAFQAIGGYDETFTHNEDAELDIRLRSAGFTIWLTQRTWSTYFPRSSPQALLTQYVNYGRGRARTTLKHRAVPKLRQLLPLMVAPAITAGVVLRVARTPGLSRLALIPPLGWALGCLGYGSVLAVREKQPAAALSGPAAMIMHLGWSIGYWRELIDRRQQ